MPFKEKTLCQTLNEAAAYIANQQNESQLYLENTVLDCLAELAFQAEDAAIADSQTQTDYLKTVEDLRDLCVKLGHPNSLKEEPLYSEIEDYFPSFRNPFAYKL